MDYMDDIRRWRAVYRLLDMVETEVFDCGLLCGSACCKSYADDPDMGIYLFPGEHLLLKELCAEDKEWLKWETQDPEELGFPASWKQSVYFVKCQDPSACRRRFRPLQCRTFPLKPVIGDQGVLELIWNDEELPYRCPIIQKNMPVHDDFYRATYTVWTHLMKDRRIFDLVMLWS